MVLLRQATPVVEEFYRYMQGAAARAVLAKNGYEAPQ
jgi:ABC-type molybdate transport system substrate-binding protein